MKKPLFSEIAQIGIVVADINKAIARWENEYGIGPWEILVLDHESASSIEVYGRPIPKDEDYKVILAMSKLGEMHLELIQPVSENSDYYFYLQKHGEGFHHVAVRQEAALFDRIEAEGIEKIGSALIGKTNCAYYDTRKDLGFIIETFVEPEQ